MPNYGKSIKHIERTFRRVGESLESFNELSKEQRDEVEKELKRRYEECAAGHTAPGADVCMNCYRLVNQPKPVAELTVPEIRIENGEIKLDSEEMGRDLEGTVGAMSGVIGKLADIARGKLGVAIELGYIQ